MALTWQNINSPRRATSNSLLESSNDNFANAFRNIGQRAIDFSDYRSDNNTEEGKAAIAGLKNRQTYDPDLAEILGRYNAGNSDLTALNEFGESNYEALDNRVSRGNLSSLNDFTASLMNADPENMPTERSLWDAIQQRGAELDASGTTMAQARDNLTPQFAATQGEAALVTAGKEKRDAGLQIYLANLKKKGLTSRTNKDGSTSFYGGSGSDPVNNVMQAIPTINGLAFGEDSDVSDRNFIEVQNFLGDLTTDNGFSVDYTTLGGNTVQIPVSERMMKSYLRTMLDPDVSNLSDLPIRENLAANFPAWAAKNVPLNERTAGAGLSKTEKALKKLGF